MIEGVCTHGEVVCIYTYITANEVMKTKFIMAYLNCNIKIEVLNCELIDLMPLTSNTFQERKEHILLRHLQ